MIGEFTMSLDNNVWASELYSAVDDLPRFFHWLTANDPSRHLQSPSVNKYICKQMYCPCLTCLSLGLVMLLCVYYGYLSFSLYLYFFLHHKGCTFMSVWLRPSGKTRVSDSALMYINKMDGFSFKLFFHQPLVEPVTPHPVTLKLHINTGDVTWYSAAKF